MFSSNTIYVLVIVFFAICYGSCFAGIYATWIYISLAAGFCLFGFRIIRGDD
jgi:hypothetical protein